MKHIIHIFKYKLLAYIRLNTKLDLTTFLKNIGSSFIYLIFAVTAFIFSKTAIRFLLEEIKIGLFLLHEFISMILFIFFIAVNVGNIIVAYSTLYRSDEVIFLFSKPVKSFKIFIIKFLDNFFYSSSTLLLMLISVIAGYAFYFSLGFESIIILIFFNFLPFIFSAASLGVILLLLLIKLASKIGVKKVIYGLTSAYVLVIFFFFKIQSPVGLAKEIMKYYPFTEKDRYLSDLIPPILKLLPNNWLSESTFWITLNKFENALPIILLQIIVSILLCSVAIFLGKRWYFDTWLKNVAITSEYLEKRKNKKSVFGFASKSLLKPQNESIIKKEFWLFIREVSQVLHLFILLLLISIFMFSVKGIQYIGFGNYHLQTMVYLSVLLFNLLLITTLSLRFVFPLISLEGLSFWKIKSAPVSNRLFLTQKLFLPGSVIFVTSQLLSFFTNYRFGINFIIFSGLITGFITVTIFSINLGMGAFFANYKDKNPIRISSSQGASLSFLISIAFMFFIIIILYNPISSYFFSVNVNRYYNISILFADSIQIIIICLLLTYIFLSVSNKSLRKDFS